MEEKITLVSVDIVGSSKIKSTYSQEVTKKVFAQWHELMKSLIDRHGGQIFHEAGDGYEFVFRSSNPEFDAFKCSLSILNEMKLFNLLCSTINEKIKLRIAMGNFHEKKFDSTPHGELANTDIDRVCKLQKKLPSPDSIGIISPVQRELPDEVKNKLIEQRGPGFDWFLYIGDRRYDNIIVSDDYCSLKKVKHNKWKEADYIVDKEIGPDAEAQFVVLLSFPEQPFCLYYRIITDQDEMFWIGYGSKGQKRATMRGEDSLPIKFYNGNEILISEKISDALKTRDHRLKGEPIRVINVRFRANQKGSESNLPITFYYGFYNKIA